MAVDRGNITTPNAADLNAAARRYAASQGWAMPDGSYPIRPANNHGAQDLAKAIRAVGRSGASRDGVRRYVMKRAGALGLMSTIPHTWQADGSLSSEAATRDGTGQQVSEARQSLPMEAAQAAGTSGRMRVQLIDAGWGSSGYYSPETLARDGAAAFPAGLHMYLDHAGLMEEQDRSGIRSVRDLAAITTDDATYNPVTQALEADVQVLAPYRDLITELAPHIGLSITGEAVAETGEVDGRTGLVITELVQGYSCDFVTHAGRGGRVLQLLEHAVHAAREGYGLTASDQADMLRAAVCDTYGGQDVYCWVRDYTDQWLVFNRSRSDDDGLFQVTYTIADGDVSFTSAPVEVFVHTQYLPVGTTPPAQPVPTSTTEESMPEISEAELRELRERPTADTVQVAEQARQAAEQRAEEAERRSQMLTAAGIARGRIDTALTEATDLPAAVTDRIRERVVANDLPLTEAGELDTTAFDQRVTEAITAEREFVATLAEQLGAGRPRGVGGTTQQATEALTEAQNKLAEAFKGFGMTDEAAALAARGRN